MSNIFVIDDSTKYLDIIANIIESKYPLANIYKCLVYQPDVIKKNPALLFFIDIDMGNTNGIDVGRKVKQLYPHSYIIFISAHNDFIHNSLLIQPFYFIRKDHLHDDFNTLWSLLELYDFTQTIIITTVQNTMSINVDDILYIESQNHIIIIHTTTADYKTHEPLKKLSKQFNTTTLCQLHKSFVVNITKVIKISSTRCFLSEDITIPIGRKYHQNFISKYKEVL